MMHHQPGARLILLNIGRMYFMLFVLKKKKFVKGGGIYVSFLNVTGLPSSCLDTRARN